MKKFVFTLMALFTFVYSESQIICHFDWNNNPVTQARVGPNATSVSSSATSGPNGANGTNGLNPALPKQDINFVIPGSPTFDVDGIDLKLDYQREESQAFIFERGSSLVIEMNGGNLSVKYRVEDGAGGFLSVSSGNVYAVPNDDTYRTYQFTYDPNTGIGAFKVNGTEVWSNDGPDSRNMYWTGAGDVMLGRLLDGSGTNKTCLDNLLIEELKQSQAQLPIELTYFKASQENDRQVSIVWATASEKNNDYFTIERSADGLHWKTVEEVKGAGYSDKVSTYGIIDHNPLKNQSYYRLKQTDFDGTFTYSNIESIFIETKIELEIYPNPATHFINIRHSSDEEVELTLFNANGQIVKHLTNYEQTNFMINVADLPNGMYLLQFNSGIKSNVKQIMISN